ncbi:hypothetical protein GBA52_010138 [Prunus armeniaca]|nr:hypothetical protein GBA52_010138 [Prunus armeniaca]
MMLLWILKWVCLFSLTGGSEEKKEISHSFSAMAYRSIQIVEKDNFRNLAYLDHLAGAGPKWVAWDSMG